MKKKQYIVPDVEIALWNTRELMSVSNPSETPDDPGTTPAPARKTDVF